MDLHESPITCVQYYADCPTDLIPHLYSAGSNNLNRKKAAFSRKVGEFNSTKVWENLFFPIIFLSGNIFEVALP